MSRNHKKPMCSVYAIALWEGVQMQKNVDMQVNYHRAQTVGEDTEKSRGWRYDILV